MAVAGVPGVASSEPLAVEAVNEGLYYHHWSNPQQTIGAGEAVKFANSTEVPHGLKFTEGSPSCTGLPQAATEASGATQWQGQCTFSTSGTYRFICTVHPTEMTGTITVNANGTTTTTTTTGAAPPSTTTTTTTAPPSEGPLAGPAAQALKVAKSQRGGAVKGSVDISTVGAGDRLEIDVFASSASIAKAGNKHTGRARVGRLIRSSVSGGVTTFSIKLDAKARRALKHRHRLALTVEVMLTPSYGEALRVKRSIVQHS